MPYSYCKGVFLSFLACFGTCAARVNQTCLRQKESETAAAAGLAFDAAASVPDILQGRIDAVTKGNNGSLALEVAHISFRYVARGNGEGKTEFFLVRTGLEMDENDNTTAAGRPEKKRIDDDVLFLDWHGEGAELISAKIARVDDSYVLTIRARDGGGAASAKVNVTRRLGHGRVPTDWTFGFFRFSPDGAVIAYTAEDSNEEGANKPPGAGAGAGGRPTVLFFYDVDKKHPWRAKDVPPHHGLGHLSWHPNSRALVGAAWKTEPYAPLYPCAADQASRIFVYRLPEDSFHFLTKLKRHYSSPRVSPGGSVMVFLENDLRTSTFHPAQIPGPGGKAKRLSLVPWEGVTDRMGNRTFIEGIRRIVIDGSPFYPLEPLPERVFSEDDTTLFCSVNLASDLRLAVVDVTTSGRAALHPSPGLVLQDVHRNVVLAKKDMVGFTPLLLAARMDWEDPPPTTAMTTTETTTEDSCAQLQHEMEMAGFINTTRPNSDSSPPPTSAPATSSTQRPFVMPVSHFGNVTGSSSETDCETAVFSFNLSSSGIGYFSAWYAIKKSELNSSSTSQVPLLVVLKDGPFTSLPRSRHDWAEATLASGMALLVVNYPGSTGMGDSVSEALIEKVGEVDVSACHKAVEFVLKNRTELSSSEVILAGVSYGGLVATHMAADYPKVYRLLVLISPVVDLLSMRHLDGYVHSLLGANYTRGDVFDERLVTEAWKRSLLRRVGDLETSVLIFAGGKDKVTPASQHGGRLHRILRSRGLNSTLRLFPGGGHQLGGHDIQREMLSVTMAWLSRHLDTHLSTCKSDPATTTTPTAGTTKRPTSTTPKSTSSPRQRGSGGAFILPTALAFFLHAAPFGV